VVRRDLDGAFHDFVVSEGPSLYRLALLLSDDSASAEDLVQVALLRAWKAWPRVCGRESRILCPSDPGQRGENRMAAWLAGGITRRDDLRASGP
jgi:hypothetical protein